jgi:hypothetical protein
MEEDPAVARKRVLTRQDEPGIRNEVVRRIAVNPIDSAALLGQRLVAAIKPQTDLRYNLAWAFGGYLVRIPQRLGVNEALDAAVDALVTAHQTFAACKEITVSSLTKYSRALSALRRCLDDPLTAGTSETLCAVSVLLLVQVTDHSFPSPSHILIMLTSPASPGPFRLAVDWPCGGSGEDTQGAKKLCSSRRL